MTIFSDLQQLSRFLSHDKMAENANDKMQAMMATFEAMLNIMIERSKAEAAERCIPMVDKLEKKEDYWVWRDRAIDALARVKLDKYVLEDVPRPAADEEEKWVTDRVDVDEYLQAAVSSNQVWLIIMGMGWSATERDPKKTFDMITRYFEGADGDARLSQELHALRRERFDSMDDFIIRLGYLRRRVERTRFKMADDWAYTWLAVKAVEKEYPDLYNRSAVQLQRNNLTWKDFRAELWKLHFEETRPVQIHESRKTEGNTGIHCNGCGRHFRKLRGGICWYCNPDHAPKGWVLRRRPGG